MSNASRYLLSCSIDENDLSPWRDLLPAPCQIVAVTLFADFVVAAGDGMIALLDVAGASARQIAASEADFWARLEDDEEGWLLKSLADDCRASGLSLAPGQCYAFTTLPMFGGAYKPENVWACSFGEWLSFVGDVYTQVKDLPPGAKVVLRVTD